jgi:hypothetical protein
MGSIASRQHPEVPLIMSCLVHCLPVLANLLGRAANMSNAPAAWISACIAICGLML